MEAKQKLIYTVTFKKDDGKKANQRFPSLIEARTFGISHFRESTLVSISNPRGIVLPL